jgi:hypothetical protein
METKALRLSATGAWEFPGASGACCEASHSIRPASCMQAAREPSWWQLFSLTGRASLVTSLSLPPAGGPFSLDLWLLSPSYPYPPAPGLVGRACFIELWSKGLHLMTVEVFWETLYAHTESHLCPAIIHWCIYILLFTLADNAQMHAAYVSLWTLLTYITYWLWDPALSTQLHTMEKCYSIKHRNST